MTTELSKKNCFFKKFRAIFLETLKIKFKNGLFDLKFQELKVYIFRSGLICDEKSYSYSIILL